MKPMTAGLAAMAIAFTGGYIASGFGVGLLCAVITLVLLPPRFDPAIIVKERQIARGEHPETPSCFGSYPFNAGLCAERECATCLSGQACLETSREQYRKD